MCLVVSAWMYPVSDSLHFLDLGGHFLSHVKEVVNYNVFKYFLRLFFSSSSGTPISRMLLCLMLSQRSETVLHSFHSFFLYSALQQLFPLFHLPGHLSVLLPQLFCY